MQVRRSVWIRRSKGVTRVVVSEFPTTAATPFCLRKYRT